MSDKETKLEDQRLKILLEKRDAFIMHKDGRCRNETESILRSKQSQAYINEESGIIAMFSNAGRTKVLSNKATEQSIQNGFTKEQHNEVASKIDKLFVYSYLYGMQGDRNNDPNIISIKRFVCPITIKGDINHYKDALVWITVKESSMKGELVHRIYSIEEMKIEQLVKKDGELTWSELFHAPTTLLPIIQKEIEVVKDFDKKFSPLLESTLKELDKNDKEVQNQNEGENNER